MGKFVNHISISNFQIPLYEVIILSFQIRSTILILNITKEVTFANENYPNKILNLFSSKLPLKANKLANLIPNKLS